MKQDDAADSAAGVVWANGLLIAIRVAGDFYSTYDATTDRWETHASEQGLWCQTPVWSGREVILWSPPSAATRLDPTTGTVSAMTRDGEPTARTSQIAVWAVDAMIVWGGVDSQTHDDLATGALYHPPLH